MKVLKRRVSLLHEGRLKPRVLVLFEIGVHVLLSSMDDVPIGEDEAQHG